MGFCRQNIKALYLENEYRKIEGNFLCLGRQSVNIKYSSIDLNKYENASINFDLNKEIQKNTIISLILFFQEDC